MANDFSHVTQERAGGLLGALKERFAYTNPMQTPRIEKVVVSVGIGKVSDKAKKQLIANKLAQITGQKVSPRPAKKSISTYKTRVGDIIGYQVTLRGPRMWAFLDKVIHVALPRTRDFRGLKVSAIDSMGNFSFGIKENTIFPETADEDLKDVFSIGITIVTSAKTKEEAEAALRHIGIPFV